MVVAVIIGYTAGYFENDRQRSELNTASLDDVQLPRISVAVRATAKQRNSNGFYDEISAHFSLTLQAISPTYIYRPIQGTIS